MIEAPTACWRDEADWAWSTVQCDAMRCGCWWCPRRPFAMRTPANGRRVAGRARKGRGPAPGGGEKGREYRDEDGGYVPPPGRTCCTVPRCTAPYCRPKAPFLRHGHRPGMRSIAPLSGTTFGPLTAVVAYARGGWDGTRTIGFTVEGQTE